MHREHFCSSVFHSLKAFSCTWIPRTHLLEAKVPSCSQDPSCQLSPRNVSASGTTCMDPRLVSAPELSEPLDESGAHCSPRHQELGTGPV